MKKYSSSDAASISRTLSHEFTSKKILLLDDNAHFQRFFLMHLHNFGITSIYTASCSKEAEQILSEVTLDLLILDIDLGDPRHTGIHLAQKARKKQAEVPIIFLTTLLDPSKYQKMRRQIGRFLMIGKDVSPLQLHNCLEIAISMFPQNSVYHKNTVDQQSIPLVDPGQHR